MKKFTAVVFLVSIVLLMSACNTIEGIGKDVKKAGEAVEQAGKK